jgi:ubiquinone/menaquinone biosynthesis C-methylase UbiE
MRKYVFSLLILITSLGFGQDQWKNIYTESAWKDRDRWQRADDIISFLKIGKSSQVADIGCHEGYMSFKLAKVVDDSGKVFAVDVDQSKIDKLKNHIAKRKLNNIEVIKGDYDDPKLGSNILDAAIILDTYHEMHDHDKILQHIKTALKPNGRLLICEAIATTRRNTTRTEQERKHELGMNFAIDDLKKAGYTILESKDNFIDREKEKGDKMWLVVATAER